MSRVCSRNAFTQTRTLLFFARRAFVGCGFQGGLGAHPQVLAPSYPGMGGEGGGREGGGGQLTTWNTIVSLIVIELGSKSDFYCLNFVAIYLIISLFFLGCHCFSLLFSFCSLLFFCSSPPGPSFPGPPMILPTIFILASLSWGSFVEFWWCF